ncbi:thiamine-phosphate kinase [Terriglobus roseus DSM 18391]|uniref:Thiamine-monophosphate kinase n=1 Tax=Terriglobus roseus (strain DSM 18391 / NRRL B-41598 / KBS 63) TaxID=926566 RepID=I3ZD91_TERRK|nr:thiamine-phosphate kinase [Terriglobus roseus]AFL87209.1 thiamine-phosphate kinase [Terriglobus roseus DSM 18391]
MANTGELALIQQIRQRAAHRSGTVRLGIGDDCAVLRPPTGHDILVTTDFSLEGRHFRRDWHPAVSVGHRCLARGLSDLAAMGAKPMAAFLSLALPEGLSKTATGRRWIQGFLAGLMALADATGTPLAGGDTAAAPGEAILADIVLLGSAPRGSELRRSTARPGDSLYVTGALGGASAEFQALAARPQRFRRAIADAAHPHLFPIPRLAAGQRLRRLATAAIDLSDGLSTDLRHLCEESAVGAAVDAAALPIHPLAQASASPLDHALNGGEDYELLFTASPTARVPKQIGGIPITRIGQITRSRGIFLSGNGEDEPLRAAGWEHRI